MASTSIPIKLLHEGEGHNVTVELKSGEIYRGYLTAAEDNMNCHLGGVTMRAKDGRTFRMENVFLRGSQIRFFILPEIYPPQGGQTGPRAGFAPAQPTCSASERAPPHFRVSLTARPHLEERPHVQEDPGP